MFSDELLKTLAEDGGQSNGPVFPDLKADVCADKADRTSLLIHGFWLG